MVSEELEIVMCLLRETWTLLYQHAEK